MSDRTRTIILCILLASSFILLYIATHEWGHLAIPS
jgi:hypothetical protein